MLNMWNEKAAFGQEACGVNRSWCCLSGWGVLKPSSTCLCTNRQLTFNLNYEGANSTTINHFTFFSDLSLFSYLLTVLPPPLSLSLVLSLTLTCTNTHHRGGVESPCFTAALHCVSVCTLQCMVYGHRPDSYYTAQCAFVAPHGGLLASIRTSPVTGVFLSLSHARTHARTHACTQLYSMPNGCYFMPVS